MKSTGRAVVEESVETGSGPRTGSLLMALAWFGVGAAVSYRGPGAS